MTDSTISRLGSLDFTPPKPIVLGERANPRVHRVAPVSHEDFDEPEFVAAPTAAIEPAPVADEAPVAEPIAQPKRTFAHTPDAKLTLRKRVAFLIAAIAVPAMAAPGEFTLPGSAPTEAQAYAALTKEKAMPFERKGMSFPGSAFFYVDETSDEGLVALPAADPSQFGGEFGRDFGSMIDAGPAAAAFFVAGSSVSQARAQRCLSEAIWYEAGTESEAGQRAVAQVVLNRVAHPNWPSSVCGVVYEGSQRTTGCQFSFTCDGSLGRKPVGASWSRAQDIAREALAGKVYTPIGLATHYHASFVNPVWASSMRHIGTIGAHQFYREAGPVGEKKAFNGTYSGIEPSVSGRVPVTPAASSPRGNASFLPSIPRIAPPRQSPRPLPAAPTVAEQTPVRPAPAPAATPTGSALANPGLRSAGQVKEQYSNAGQWKKRPGTSDPAQANPQN